MNNGSTVANRALVGAPTCSLGGVHRTFCRALSAILSRVIYTTGNTSVTLTRLEMPFLDYFVKKLRDNISVQSTGVRNAGCGKDNYLIRKLAILTSSFVTVSGFIRGCRGGRDYLIRTLRDGFRKCRRLQTFLLSYPGFNGRVTRISGRTTGVTTGMDSVVGSQGGCLKGPFHPSFSDPSARLACNC